MFLAHDFRALVLDAAASKNPDKMREIFPWKRGEYADDDIKGMMAKLSHHFKSGLWKTRISKERFSFPNIASLKNTTYNGKNLMITSLPSDYEDWNVLSDMFTEEQRLSARLSTCQKSAYNFFFENTDELFKNYEDNSIVTPHDIREMLYQARVECTSFRPNILVTIVGMLNSTKVLDFSSGWGDRLIGAIACEVEYVGIDPNEKLQSSYKSIKSFFGVDTEKYRTLVGKAQDIETLLPEEENFDLVFTSPPYWTYEIYDESSENQSSNFRNETEWFEGFLKPALVGAWNKLQDDGHLVININHTSRNQTYVLKMIDFVNSFDDSTYLGVMCYVNERSKKSPQPIFVWKKSMQIGTPFVTIYEKTKMISMRACQLSADKSQPHPSITKDMLENKFKYDPILIAKYEIENGLVENFVIQREIYKGKFQRQDAHKMFLPPC